MTNPLIQRYNKATAVCGLFHLEDWAVLRLTGKDCRDFLNRMSTADLRKTNTEYSIQTLFLRGDGRLVADALVVCLNETDWLLVCASAFKASLELQLDRFIFTEDVKVSDVSCDYYLGLVLGDRRDELTAFLATGDKLRLAGGVAVPVSIAPGADRILVLVPAQATPEIRTKLYGWLDSAQGVIGDRDLYETLRIESGIPAVGRELTEKTIPLEASLKSAISFTKGCFPGQEIVARINNLGHPANVLVGLKLPETTEDLTGQPLFFQSKVVGRITSSAFSPKLHGMVGLGYAKWTQREVGTLLSIGETGKHQATVIEMPLLGRQL